jgi:hypothetical protein
MGADLKDLIEVAKRVTPTPEHREEQRRSFAYGNTAFENPRITREMVDQQAEKLAADGKPKACGAGKPGRRTGTDHRSSTESRG